MFHWKDYVYEVYKERSFSKAAQNLYISQPSLSARIKKVENELGFLIFDRSTTPLQLTEHGEAYIKAIKEIYKIEHDFEDYINNLNTLKTGHLAIGATNVFAAYVLPPLITTFKNMFPNVSIQLIEGNTAQLEKMLNDNTLDFVVDNYHYDDQIYNKEKYCLESLLLAVPKQFSVNKKLKDYQLSHAEIKNKDYRKPEFPSVPLHEFSDIPFIMLTPGNDTRVRGDKICNRAGFHPDIILELNQQATAYMAASTQLGATFIGDFLAAQLPSFENLVYYKLSGDYTQREVFFYYRKNKYKTRVMDEFIKLMHK